MKKYTSIRPAKIWLDTNGNRIQAHGGSIFYENGTYYWYGENKELTDGKNGIWHNGVRAYSSVDLYNWKDEGLILKPHKSKKSSLNQKSYMDRPHILYNEKTKKYVMWIKIMNKDGTQTQTICTAKKLLGPYKIIKEGYRPLNMDAGDFDLTKDSDGKAYYYFEKVHTETVCADLDDDYTSVTGNYSTHFQRIAPPYVREATSHFFRNGKHYLVTSGTTGYYPNPTEVAVADGWHGPFKVLDNPHRNDDSKTSFHSQISSIFKVPDKKDLYIALADRWLPNKTDIKYEVYESGFKHIFIDKIKVEDLPQEEKDCLDGTAENTSVADYVWLPLKFEGDNVYIDWYDEWKIEDFD